MQNELALASEAVEKNILGRGVEMANGCNILFGMTHNTYRVKVAILMRSIVLFDTAKGANKSKIARREKQIIKTFKHPPKSATAPMIKALDVKGPERDVRNKTETKLATCVRILKA